MSGQETRGQAATAPSAPPPLVAPSSPSTAAAPAKVWTANFILLWQGQLVSIFGDVVYAIALGFWVLAVTGSTGLMGALMAASTLPRILVSPVAGVVVDRFDRRALMIWMDTVRGAAVVAVAVAAFAGFLQVWMVFVVGVILGVCGAFFSPGVNSIIPDITARDKIVQANSVFGMLQPAGNIVGNAAGGVLFAVLGAPVLFLFNGLSYLFSAGSLFFTRIPKVAHLRATARFRDDLRAGLLFVWKIRGLRLLLLTAAVLNFFSSMAIMLFLPFFQRNPALGAARYGVAMAMFMGGSLLGMAFTASLKIPAPRRFLLFVLFGIESIGCLIAFPFSGSFGVIIVLLGAAGFGNAIINVFIMAVMQLAVPQEMRGKVFSLMNMLTQGLTPIAFALAGVLAEFLPLPPLMSGCFVVALVMAIPVCLAPSFRRFISFDPQKDTVASVS
jgi:DHA3 family macrolide efflux protein-like MFS transporter